MILKLHTKEYCDNVNAFSVATMSYLVHYDVSKHVCDFCGNNAMINDIDGMLDKSCKYVLDFSQQWHNR